MNEAAVTEVKKEVRVKPTQKSFSWVDNPDIQKLLDVTVSILADEYIRIAKQNPEVFSNNGGEK